MMFGKNKNNLKNQPKAGTLTERRSRICDNVSFAVSEAYKLLRTNITFSFTGDAECRVIGVTSAQRSDGKSLTSINTAYSIAQSGKSVLLMECDLRVPTIARRLSVQRSPGLSNLLVGLDNNEDIIRSYVSEKAGVWFDVIVAGDTPPNPSELLGSDKMKSYLDQLKQHYDYIIMDLPPVVPVTDALVVSKITDGVVLVVRQDYTERHLLAESVKQLEFVNAKVLGFVLNASTESAGRYGKRYGKYYKTQYYYSEQGQQ